MWSHGQTWNDDMLGLDIIPCEKHFQECLGGASLHDAEY